MVSCVYVNSNSNQFWLIDYRVYDPDSDGKSKLDHRPLGDSPRDRDSLLFAPGKLGWKVIHSVL